MGNIRIVILLLVPFFTIAQNYPRFELYQLKQGTDSGQFVLTGVDSNLAFNNVLRFRSADSTFLIGADTVITDKTIIPILLKTIDAGLGIDVNQVDEQIFIESLSLEDSIYNGTASLISKGTPLYAVGVQGNYWSVAPADASDPNKMPVICIAGEDIASGGTGLGLIFGHIKQVNTTGLADGAEVYVGVGGGYTSTKPTAEGVIIQRLGTVIKGNSTNGSGIINLGDEGFWNDFVSRTELSDSLALFIKTEVDGSVTNELQTLSKLGLDITLSNGGGTVKDSILTEAQVDSYVSNNGYLTSEVDGDITNELQTISKVGQNITLSDGGGTVRDSILTETQVDAYVANNGYLTSEVDGSVTNEIQNISTTGTAGNISISSGSTLTLNVNDADSNVSNEGSLSVGAGTSTTSLINSNTSGSTPVTLTAGTNITLSETGNNITIAASGGGSSLWTEGATSGEIYYNGGNVGVGLTDPFFPLDVGGNLNIEGNLYRYGSLVTIGDITGVTAGSGLIGGGTSGDVTLNVGGGTGIDVAADAISVDVSDFMTNGANNRIVTATGLDAMTAETNLTYDGVELNVGGDIDFSGDLYNNGVLVDLSGGTGDITSVTAGNGLTGGGLSGDVTLNVVGGTGISASADFISTVDGEIVHDNLFGFVANEHINHANVGVFAGNGLTGGGDLTAARTINVGGGYGIDVTSDNIAVDVSDFMSNGVNNRILTATGTDAMTANSGLTWDDTYFKIYKTSRPYIYLQNSTTGTLTTDGAALSIDSNNDFLLYNNETNGTITLQNLNGYIILKSSGEIGIGDLAGVSDIGADIDGVLQAATSDTTLKTNILPNQYGLKKVMDIETIKFNWKDKKRKGAQKEVGFNAQNLKKVIPEATYTIPSNGKLGIKDDAIIATLTKAIQEQQLTIELQDKRIQQLEEMVKQLINNKQ